MVSLSSPVRAATPCDRGTVDLGRRHPRSLEAHPYPPVPLAAQTPVSVTDGPPLLGEEEKDDPESLVSRGGEREEGHLEPEDDRVRVGPSEEDGTGTGEAVDEVEPKGLPVGHQPDQLQEHDHLLVALRPPHRRQPEEFAAPPHVEGGPCELLLPRHPTPVPVRRLQEQVLQHK